MQWQENSRSIFLAGKATNKEKEGMKSWILLDSESTTDIFGESKYITNIKTVPTTLKLMNDGVLLTTN